MYELLWFVGGALAYQFLTKTLKIAQLYMFFLEVHTHMLLMLEAASQDLEAAVDLKKELFEESGIEQDQITLINNADKQAVVTWRTTTVFKIQKFIPSSFRPAIEYNNWNELEKYLSSILKDERK